MNLNKLFRVQLNILNRLLKILYVHTYKLILYYNYKINIKVKKYIKRANP